MVGQIVTRVAAAAGAAGAEGAKEGGGVIAAATEKAAEAGVATATKGAETSVAAAEAANDLAKATEAVEATSGPSAALGALAGKEVPVTPTPTEEAVTEGTGGAPPEITADTIGDTTGETGAALNQPGSGTPETQGEPATVLAEEEHKITSLSPEQERLLKKIGNTPDFTEKVEYLRQKSQQDGRVLTDVELKSQALNLYYLEKAMDEASNPTHLRKFMKSPDFLEIHKAMLGGLKGQEYDEQLLVVQAMAECLKRRDLEDKRRPLSPRTLLAMIAMFFVSLVKATLPELTGEKR